MGGWVGGSDNWKYSHFSLKLGLGLGLNLAIRMATEKLAFSSFKKKALVLKTVHRWRWIICEKVSKEWALQKLPSPTKFWASASP